MSITHDMKSVPDILDALSDSSSILLIKTIALEKSAATETLQSKTKLTSKQYYLRMSRFIDVGLVKRKHKRHHLTSIGKIVYGILLLLENMLADEWRLKAIDSLEISGELTNEERNKITNALVDVSKIKSILAKPLLE